MQKFLDAVVAKLPVSLQPIAKSLVPVTLAAAVVVQDLVISAEEVAELKVLAAGAVTSIVVYLIRNISNT